MFEGSGAMRGPVNCFDRISERSRSRHDCASVFVRGGCLLRSRATTSSDYRCSLPSRWKEKCHGCGHFAQTRRPQVQRFFRPSCVFFGIEPPPSMGACSFALDLQRNLRARIQFKRDVLPAGRVRKCTQIVGRPNHG